MHKLLITPYKDSSAILFNILSQLKSKYTSLVYSSPPQCINEEGFRQFLKTYLEVEDFPSDLCQRLFRSFQNSKPTQEDGTSEIIYVFKQLVPFTLQQALISLHYELFAAQSFIAACLFSTHCAEMISRVFTALCLSSISSVEEVFLKDVSCYFSLLEDGQPRDKLECKSFVYFLPRITRVTLWRFLFHFLVLFSCFQAL